MITKIKEVMRLAQKLAQNNKEIMRLTQNIKDITEVMGLTQDIREMLNELQELSAYHFQIPPKRITNKQVKELQAVHKWIKHTLKKAKRVSQ